jgi:hypothetical protein
MSSKSEEVLMRRKSREIRELGKWFRSKAKPFLLQELPDRVAELEKELDSIEHPYQRNGSRW